MIDETGFQTRVQKIGELVHELEAMPDPAIQARAKELVQSLMDMHGAAVERILEVIFQSGEPGAQIIDDLGRDPLVSSLLVLYGLHPEDLPTRVERSLRELASKLHKVGAEAKLVSADDGNVRVQISIDGHACGSTSRTVQAMVEEAIYNAAPDLNSLVVEGAEQKQASGFVAMDSLLKGSHPLVAPLSNSAVDVRRTALSEGMD